MNPDDQRVPNPAQGVHPVQPIQPARFVQPSVSPEAIAAALTDEPAPSPVPAPTPAPIASPAAQTVPQPQAAPVVVAPVSVTAAPPVLETVPVQQPVDTQDDNQQYDEDDTEQSDDAPVTWVAKEYIHNEKGATWFMIFGVVVAVLLAISIFFMQSWTFAVLLGVIAAVVVVYSRRPPRELTYSLTDDGLTIDETLHEFDKFKSFGVIQDGEEYSVMLIPTQRFQPGVTVYFPEEAGEDIVDMLGSRLPMKELHLDMVDRAVRFLRL